MRSTILQRLATLTLAAGLGVGSVMAGNLDELQYLEVPGARVTDLYTGPNSTTFPANPGYYYFGGFIPAFEPLINPSLPYPPDTFIQTLGGIPNRSATMIRGFIEPPQTGDYTFWVTGSSDAEFYLSTSTAVSDHSTGASPTCYTDGTTANNAWATRTTQKSAPIHLIKGNQYYFELVHKSDGLGGLAQLGWWLPDYTLQRPIPIRYAQRYAFAANCDSGNGCSGSFLTQGTFTPPVVDRGPGNNGTDPQIDIQAFVTAGQPLDLTPWISANYPVAFQWQNMDGYVFSPRNDGTPSNLSGEITSTKYIKKLTVADHDGKAYRLRMVKNGNTNYTTVVNLVVTEDFTSPTVITASAVGNTNGFNVVYSEDVDPTTATNAANYELNNGVTIDHIEMLYGETPNNTVVVYTTAEVPGNTTVRVTNVRDLSAYEPDGTAGNVIIDDNVHNVADVLLTDGIISSFYYGAINGGSALAGGTDVQSLINATNRFTDPYLEAGGGNGLTNRKHYPGSPDLSLTLDSIHIPVNVANNYGTLVCGFIVPPETGAYNFAIVSDDQSVLYLSPDEHPENMVPIAAEVQWNADLDFGTDTRHSISAGVSATDLQNIIGNNNGAAFSDTSKHFNQSKNIVTGNETYLAKGGKYYIEALMRENGGGDNLSVTWELPGTWSANINSVAGLDPIPGTYLKQFATAGQSGPITILTQPADTTVEENRPFTLSVVHGGSPSFSYQWYYRGVAIPDANGRTYTNPLPDPDADNGADYKVLVRNLFSQEFSAPAILTVIVDTNAPVLVRAVGSASYDHVTIWFDENVDPVTAVNPGNYSIKTTTGGTGLSVLGTGVLGGKNDGGYTQVTFATGPQTENVNYTVTVNNVKDIANVPNVIAQDSTVKFTGFVKTKGFVQAQFYNNIGGTAISGMTSAAAFPNSPNTVRTFAALSFGENTGFGDTYGDNYGSRFAGTLTAPSTGDYRFFIRSDDASQFFLNLSGTATPSYTGTPLMREDGCCNAFLEPDATQTSAFVHLTAGTQYGFLLLQKEGGGGDWVQVAMRKSTDSTAAGSLPPISGGICCAIANPDETTFNFTSQPQSVTGVEVTTVSFSAGGSGQTLIDKLANPPTTAPVAWQWQRKRTNDTDFVDIAGAYSSGYTTGLLTPQDNGAQFRVLASIPGLTSTSDVATVTVIVDVDNPVIRAITGAPANPSGVENIMKVYYSERVTRSLAEDVANYTITGPGNASVAVNSASLSSDEKTVTLTTAALTPGTTYTVSVKDITDISQAAHVLDPNPTTKQVTAWTLSTGLVRQQLYFDISGDENALTNNSRWPNSPSTDHYISTWDTPPSDCCGAPNRDNFGTRMTGLITPTETADYYFAISGDDHQLFFLSTDTNPANKKLIVAEPQWNGHLDWTTQDRRVGGNNYFPGVAGLPINRSDNTVKAITLTAGVSYYAESIGKEGGGGDSSAVTWWKSTDTIPASGTPGINGSFVQNYINPDNSITVASGQPANQTVTEGDNATFSVSASTYEPQFGGPVTYQWLRGGTPINGATGSSYTLNGATVAADNGAQFSVQINAPGAPQVTSPTATLTVNPVLNPPTLAITKSGNNVIVTYPKADHDAGNNLEKATSLSSPLTFNPDNSGADSNPSGTWTTTVDVTAQGADNQSYWRTKK